MVKLSADNHRWCEETAFMRSFFLTTGTNMITDMLSNMMMNMMTDMMMHMMTNLTICLRRSRANGNGNAANELRRFLANGKVRKSHDLCSDASRRPIDVRGRAQAELGDEAGGAVEVVEVHHLDGTVHVAVGDADDGGGDAVAGELHDVGVGAGRPRGAADLDWDFQGAGGQLEALEDAGVDVRAAEQDRTAAEFRLAQLL